MKNFYSILGALLIGATSLFAQTNYTITFSANVEMEKVQVKNLSSGETKMLYSPDNVITLQKNATQEQQGGTETPIESVNQLEFLRQTANNEVVVNMEKAGRLNLTLYSSNGTFVTRYANNVDAGPNAFHVGASTGVYVLVASANNQTASLKIVLTQSTQPSILEILTSKPEPLLKSIDDVITFDEGDKFEFTGYYYNQTDVKTAVITANKTITFSFTKVTAPTVSTVQATNITTDAATVGGNVTNDNGATVTERGVCWSTKSTPTISDNKKVSGKGTGSFSVLLSSLAEETTYYVRAYAVNSEGTVYGNQITFTTVKNVSLPNVSTVQATNISTDAATVGGNVITDNGATVIERGVCWSTTPNPTVSNNKRIIGNGTGSFNTELTSLTEGTTYYVRAYAVNSIGTAYGNEITFTTEMIVTTGEINGLFSVAENTKVCFSQGNLQYQASTGRWRFAENQYDAIGEGNKNISSTYDGWIDLFGWGTSGWNSGAKAYQPYSTSKTDSDYYVGGSSENSLTNNYVNADWGKYNVISNGSNKHGGWRTLSITEWEYLLLERPNASKLSGLGSVNGVNGLILLPDDFLTKISISSVSGKISLEVWNVMQSYGAVFLPAAGERSGINLVNIESSWGYYWSSTVSDKDDNGAYYLEFQKTSVVQSFGLSTGNRYYGRSVRLVKDVK